MDLILLEETSFGPIIERRVSIRFIIELLEERLLSLVEHCSFGGVQVQFKGSFAKILEQFLLLIVKAIMFTINLLSSFAPTDQFSFVVQKLICISRANFNFIG